VQVLHAAQDEVAVLVVGDAAEEARLSPITASVASMFEAEPPACMLKTEASTKRSSMRGETNSRSTVARPTPTTTRGGAGRDFAVFLAQALAWGARGWARGLAS
jgi:hypothetical protein